MTQPTTPFEPVKEDETEPHAPLEPVPGAPPREVEEPEIRPQPARARSSVTTSPVVAPATT